MPVFALCSTWVFRRTLYRGVWAVAVGYLWLPQPWGGFWGPVGEFSSGDACLWVPLWQRWGPAAFECWSYLWESPPPSSPTLFLTAVRRPCGFLSQGCRGRILRTAIEHLGCVLSQVELYSWNKWRFLYPATPFQSGVTDLFCAGRSQLPLCVTACVPALQGWLWSSCRFFHGQCGEMSMKAWNFFSLASRYTRKLFLHTPSTPSTLRELSWNSGIQTMRSCSRIRSTASIWQQRRAFYSARAWQLCQAYRCCAIPWTWCWDAA